MIKKSKILTVILATTLLGACTSGDGAPPAKLSFDKLQPYPVYVASYEILTTPHVDSLKIPEGFVANPVQIAQDYFSNRFTETGTQGKLSVIIEKADVTHKIEKSKSKVGAFIGVDHYDVYNILLSVKLRVLDVSGFERQENTITARQMVSISEHVSLAERERLQMETMDALMDDVDGAVKAMLGKDFGVMH